MIGQKWEYRTMLRAYRTLRPEREKGKDYLSGMPGLNKWNVDIAQMLPDIGNEGWELAAISSRTSTYSIDGQSGLETEEVWVFKRPKP